MSASYPVANFLTGTIVTAGILFGSDVIFRPQMAGGINEYVRFFLEGAVVNYMVDYSPGTGLACKQPDFMRILLTSITIAISDVFLRIDFFGNNEVMAFVKFFIQAAIVNWILDWYDKQ